MGEKLVAEILYGAEPLVVSGNILSADFTALDRGNVTDLIEYGIYANRGNISFLDYDGKFKELYDKYNGTTIGKVSFWLGYNETALATLDIESAIINEETKQIELSLVSPLLQWQNIKISRTLFIEHNLLYYSKDLVDIIDALNTYYNTDIYIYTDRVRYTKIFCPDIEDDITLWDLITQICQVGLCRVFDDEYGRPCIYDPAPNKTNVIVINPSNIIRFGSPVITSIPNLSISVLSRDKQLSSVIDKRTIYFYDSDGTPVDFEQDVEIVGRLDDANLVTAGTIYTVTYTITLPKNAFNFIYQSALSNVYYSAKGEWFYALGTNNIISRSARVFSIIATPKDNLSRDKSIVVKIYGTAPQHWLEDPDQYKILLSADISLTANSYTDNDSLIKEYTTSTAAAKTPLSTNKLFQERNTFDGNDFSEEILDTIKNRYANPIRCLEMECVLGEYNDIIGNVALSKNQTFKKYDLVAPYVIRNNKKQPYSINQDGNASVYQIVGIEYSYKGILRQNLHLQEVVTA